MASIAEANALRQNHSADFSDFPSGSRVKVVSICVDCFFFDPDTQNLKGTVVKNSGSYLGIRVKWDEPRHYEDGYVQEYFGFNPKDLVLLDSKKKNIWLKIKRFKR